MVRTTEGLLSEMRAVCAITEAIKDLTVNAPESRVLSSLHEAARVAHPACFAPKENEAVHALFKARHPDLLLPITAAVDAKRADTAAVVASAGANLDTSDVAKLLTLLASLPPDTVAAAQRMAAGVSAPGDTEVVKVG